jgi:hypothetical protein
MSKWQNDSMLDAALNYVADNGSQLDVVSDTSTPTDLTNSLASTSLTVGDGNGDYTVQDGDSSGRKLTIAQQADISVTASGDANHIVISDGGSPPTLYLVTTCTTQSLTSGNTVTVPSFDDEIADAS